MKKVVLPEGYKPQESEEYMSELQLEYYKQKLLAWKDELLQESKDTLKHLKEESWKEPDINDRASLESETALELRTRGRYKKLLDKIDDALSRIQNHDYGYCEETGEKIGLKRLEARPVATLCVEAQEKREKFEKEHSME